MERELAGVSLLAAAWLLACLGASRHRRASRIARLRAIGRLRRAA